jgi:hypothetical protein
VSEGKYLSGSGHFSEQRVVIAERFRVAVRRETKTLPVLRSRAGKGRFEAQGGSTHFWQELLFARRISCSQHRHAGLDADPVDPAQALAEIVLRMGRRWRLTAMRRLRWPLWIMPRRLRRITKRVQLAADENG